MKFIAVMTLLWLLCGMVAAFQIESRRSATLSEIAAGPITLLPMLLGRGPG